HIGERRVGRQFQRRRLGNVLYQKNGAWNLAHGAHDLRVTGVTDQDQRSVLGNVPLALIVHLGDQRTGGIQRRQMTRFRMLLDTAATPWAEKTVIAPSGTSSNSLTKTAPFAFRLSTTYLLWTISCRT